MTLSVDHIRELPTLAWDRQPQKYGVERLYRALGEHENGDFRASSELIRIMLRDARVSSCLATRVNAVLGCREQLVAPDGLESAGDRAIEDTSTWWWTALDESTRAQMFVWGIMSGVSVLSQAWDMQPDRLTPKSFRALPNDGLFWDEGSRKLYYQAEGQSAAEEVIHGDGRWIVFAPWGYRSWTQGKVLSLADCWLMRQWTRRDHARRNELLGLGIVKGKTPAGADVGVQDRFAAKLRRMGSAGVIICPQAADGSGFDADLIEPEAGGHQLFADFIAQQNVDIAVGLLGQNLTTEVPSGGVYGTMAHGAVRQDYLEWDVRAEADCLRSGAIVPFVVLNGGDAAAAPWPQRDTDPPEDEKAKAETQKTRVETLAAAAAMSPRVDVERGLEEAGFVLLDPADVPDPQIPAPATPTGDDGGDLPSALSKGRGPLVRLAGDSPSRFLHAGQTWANGLVEAATELAQPDVAKVILSIKRAAKESSGFEDFRLRLIDLASEAPSKAAESLFERAILLAVGQGTYSASLEIDAGP